MPPAAPPESGDAPRLAERLSAYVAHRLPGASEVGIDGLARIHGGSSQETWRFRAMWREAGHPREQALILRRAPEAGLVEIEPDLEFSVYSALAGKGFPVPDAWWFEPDADWLDRPFLIMDLMPGKPGHFFGSNDPYEGMGDAVARDFWHRLGLLATMDSAMPGLGRLRNAQAGGSFALRELDYWRARLDVHEAVIEPVVRGAIRWLRAHPPPDPARPAICHGDYRGGNFLFVPPGTISAVLDWEMCHVSDPLEDVAWAVNPMWTMERSLPLEQGLAIWQQASGVPVDRQALDWWRLFAAVKACALWTAAEATFQDGTSREMIVALTAMRAGHFHRSEILDRMAVRGGMG